MTYLVSSTGPNLCHLLLLFLPPQNVHQLQDAEDSKEKQENASLCLPFYWLPQQRLNFIKDRTIAKLSQWFSITDLIDTRPGLFTYFVTILDVLWHFAGGKVLENLKSCLIFFALCPVKISPRTLCTESQGRLILINFCWVLIFLIKCKDLRESNLVQTSYQAW